MWTGFFWAGTGTGTSEYSDDISGSMKGVLEPILASRVGLASERMNTVCVDSSLSPATPRSLHVGSNRNKRMQKGSP
jgi:hypothetical protein